MNAADLDAGAAHAAFLLDDLGLSGAGWRFRWTTDRSRLGVCDFRARTVGVSRVLAERNTHAVLLDTVAHEVAHACAGPTAGHGPAWREWALLLGATPRATAVAVGPAPRWLATCADCGEQIGRQRRGGGDLRHAKCERLTNGGALSWARADEGVDAAA